MSEKADAFFTSLPDPEPEPKKEPPLVALAERSWWGLLLYSVLEYLEIWTDKSMTIYGKGTQNRVTWDELSVLPFWQSLPYRIHLKKLEVSDQHQARQHEEEVAEELAEQEWYILDAIQKHNPFPSELERHVCANPEWLGSRYDFHLDEMLDDLKDRKLVAEVIQGVSFSGDWSGQMGNIEGRLELTEEGKKVWK